MDVPFTPRCQQWNAREVWQWRIAEVIRVTTDVPDLVGYSKTILHYTWGRVPDAAIERVRGGNPADFLGDNSLGAGLQMALSNLVGKALGVPVWLFNLPKLRDWCPISWWNVDSPPEANAAEAQAALASGYTRQDQGPALVGYLRAGRADQRGDARVLPARPRLERHAAERR